MVSMLPATLVLTALIAAYSVSAGVSLQQDKFISAGDNITVSTGCTLVFTRTGNLELLFHRGNYQKILWSAGISVYNPKYAIMQGDGNLVAVDENGRGYWNSPSESSADGPFRLDLQEDCNLVIYNSAYRAVWSTKTAVVRQTMFENVRFNFGDILVHADVPSCWMTYHKVDNGLFLINTLTLSYGKKQVWQVGKGGNRFENAFQGVDYLVLTPLGQFLGQDGGLWTSDSEWFQGLPNQGTAPYQLILVASGDTCTFEIRDASGGAVFTLAP